MVFLDVVLPWNCSVLSVKALEFEVRFGMNAFLWQTINLKYICLFVVSYGFEPLCGERDWLNTFKNISVGCWKVERETDKKKTVYMRILRRRMFPPSQEEKKNHSVNSVKQNTHIRFNSYLTKLYLIFILARFALVLIPAIQISISGTYCYSRLYIRKKVSSLLSNLQILTKSHSSFSPNIQLATHIIPLPPIQVDFIIWGIQDPFNLSI